MQQKTNFFLFNGQLYEQTDGVAMGSRLGPLLANVFMCSVEETKCFKKPLLVRMLCKSVTFPYELLYLHCDSRLITCSIHLKCSRLPRSLGELWLNLTRG